ncbi:PREDICTED: uncharacterized protein LOC106814912 isoform X5 [Priapulus caudatus]|uniref:Uncharacterized protein LOC106814912 isoform X5 n=1 Tax=Priapulus caudatus TaxID=37621 RepID=A0ABM1ERG1_PRICU|nr:PREDICTED: uncharacterized protein LOC106814912 isoform X5 [Priapulus caudatus]
MYYLQSQKKSKGGTPFFRKYSYQPGWYEYSYWNPSYFHEIGYEDDTYVKPIYSYRPQPRYNRFVFDDEDEDGKPAEMTETNAAAGPRHSTWTGRSYGYSTPTFDYYIKGVGLRTTRPGIKYPPYASEGYHYKPIYVYKMDDDVPLVDTHYIKPYKKYAHSYLPFHYRERYSKPQHEHYYKPSFAVKNQLDHYGYVTRRFH